MHYIFSDLKILITSWAKWFASIACEWHPFTRELYATLLHCSITLSPGRNNIRTTTTISKVIQRVYSRSKGGNKNVPHHNFGVHAPPKMTFCQPNSSDDHAALYISTDPQTFVLMTFQPWRREVWMDLGPFGASHKQEQAFAKHLNTTHYWNIHSSLAKTKSNASLSALVSLLPSDSHTENKQLTLLHAFLTSILNYILLLHATANLSSSH